MIESLNLPPITEADKADNNMCNPKTTCAIQSNACSLIALDQGKDKEIPERLWMRWQGVDCLLGRR